MDAVHVIGYDPKRDCRPRTKPMNSGRYVGSCRLKRTRSQAQASMSWPRRIRVRVFGQRVESSVPLGQHMWRSGRPPDRRDGWSGASGHGLSRRRGAGAADSHQKKRSKRPARRGARGARRSTHASVLRLSSPGRRASITWIRDCPLR